jgi:hypothetical protein
MDLIERADEDEDTTDDWSERLVTGSDITAVSDGPRLVLGRIFSLKTNAKTARKAHLSSDRPPSSRPRIQITE